MGGPILNVLRQRTTYDGGVVCLAMYLGVTYDAAIAAFERGPHGFDEYGCSLWDIEEAAERLGARLKRIRAWEYNVGTADGIVCIGTRDGWHTAILSRALLFSTLGQVWIPSDYLNSFAGKFPEYGAMLVWDGPIEGCDATDQ